MDNKNATYGLTAEHPVMVTDVATSYSYLDGLVALDSNVSYRRIKSTFSSSVNGVLDKYEILLKDEHYSFLFIYPYAMENDFTIAETFEALSN